MPEPIQGNATPQAPEIGQGTPSPQPSASPSPQVSPGSPSVPSQPSGSSSIPQQPEASPSAGSPSSWLSELRAAGVPFQEGVDEKAALTALANLYKDYAQVQPIAPYVSAYQQHAPEFNKWLAERNKQAQPQTPRPQQDEPWHQEFWNPPEFNPAWQSMVRVDPTTGVMSAIPGAPPGVVQKLQEYQAFRQDQAEKFMSNPAEYIAPIVRKLAAEEARNLMQSQLTQRDEVAQGQQIVAQHSDWLYAKDAAGNKLVQPQYNPMTGQMHQAPVLSEWGVRYRSYAQEAYKRGWDTQTQHEYAMMRVQNDSMAMQIRQQQQPVVPVQPVAPPPTPREAANTRFNKQANPPVPAKGNSVPAAGATPEKNGRSSAFEVLKKALNG